MNTQTSRNRWLWLAPLALAFALLGILLVLLPAQAQGSIRYVAATGADSGNCSDSGSPCLTIGYAISQAGAGDTIQIAAGAYIENLTVDRALTIAGAGAASTFVDGGGTDRVFTMTAAVAVAGLTIQNGAAADYGGGIRTNSALTLTNVTVYSNTAQIGGGVYAEGATPYAASMVITGSQFLSNTASNGMGGGLMFYGWLTIADSRFDGNRAIWGGGGGIYATGPITLTGVEFTNNSATQSGTSGGAVNAVSGPATNIIAAMTNVTVTGNTAVETAGGVLLDGYARATLVGGRFEANRCTDNGCIGGGLTLANDTPASLTATQFISNEAGYQGGGLATSDAITITQGYFERNRLRQSDGMGGGLSAGGNTVLASVADTHFISNTAGTGGGVRFFGPAQLTGGAFAGNTGGGVYAARKLTIAPTLPYTYRDDFTLEGSLSAMGDLTFTTGMVTFWDSGATHYLTNTAPTTFDRLSVSAQSGVAVLDVGTSAVSVSGVFTNAGVIHRLAPTQTVALAETYIYTDGVGQPTVLLRQTGGAAMGDTSVRVSARLATTNFVCNGTALSPQAVRRYFDINSGGDDTNVTADLTLRYHAPASPFYTEANNTTPDTLVIYHCDGVRWVMLNGSYTRGVEGDYRWVKLSGYTFSSFSPFVLGDPPSTDATLADLALNAGTLTPTFDWATVSYTASVPNSAASIRVTAIVSDDTAALQINGLAATSGVQSDPISLIVGANVITTFVTAQDGVTTKTYTVTVTRPPSSNANLTGLTLGAGTLTPPFATTTTDYTATVGFGATTLTVTPAVTDTTATIRVNGVVVASGAASAPIALVVGSNVITTVVTAEDGVTTRTHTVTVTRAGDASLAALDVSTGDLTPTFISSTLAYTTPAVTKLVAAAQVTAATTYAGDAISIVAAANGGSAAACPGAACALAVGSNVISVTVMAADATARTYTVTLTRLPSANADLTGLTVRYGTLAPPFAPTTTVYTTNVPSFALTGVITPTAADADASIVVNGTAVPSGSPAPALPLNFGDNVISVTVTAEDLTATRVYTVTVTRLAPASPWYVQPDGNDGNLCTAFGSDLACRTIRGAMNKAAAGDTLYIGAGVYTESLVITRALTFIGVNTPTVSGGGTQRVISITAGVDVTLNGLIIAGGYLTGTDLTTSAGAGIYNAGNLTVTNSTLTGNQATHFDWGQGGALFVAATGAARVIDSTIVSNTATYGGGIVSRGGAVLVDHTLVASNVVTGYVASSGGGIYMSSGAVTITNGSQIVENRAAMAASEGGGIRTVGGQLLVTDSAILSNTAIKGGGASINGGIATLDGALVAGNFVTNSTQAMGGGLYLQGVSTTVTVTRSIVDANRVFGSNSLNSGGGIFVNSGVLRLIDSTLTGNHAYNYGGGLYIDFGAGHLITGAVFAANTANMGGALAARSSDPLAIYNTTVYSNSAVNGSGGGVYANPPLTLVGGAIYSNTSNSNGAGVYAFAALTMTNVTVHSNANSLSSYGAGVFAYDSAIISGSRIENNRCTGACKGVGLYTYSPTALLTLVDTQFISNVATDRGGGLYAKGPVSMSGGEFRGNRAGSSVTSGGLFAEKILTITASAPFTYLDGFELLSDLAVSENLTLTTGIVSFVVDPSAPTTVVTHTLRSAAATSFNHLAVVDNAVLDVGSAVVRVSDVFTNAGVIHRLAPAQSIDTLNTPYTFDDGVGQATVVVTQTGGAALGATTVRVRAHLAQTAITCAGAPLPVTGVRRFFTITPTSSAAATADLKLSYFAGVQNSEANGVTPPNLAIFRCNNGVWEAPDTLYTTGVDGVYQTVSMTGLALTGVADYAIGALPARDAALANLTLHTATTTPPLTPAFAAATTAYTTTVAHQTLTVTVTPIVSGTTGTVRVNGAAVASGTASASIDLLVGANVITTVVTAQDGVTTQSYTVTVTRASDATLSDLVFDFGPLTPAFVSTTLVYTAQVGGGVISVVVTPTTGQPTDGIGVVAAANGGASATCMGAPLTCPLAVGVTVITTTVTAADGTPRVYVVTVTRPSSAQLGALALDPVNFTPVFTGTTFVYTATTGNTTANTLVTATAAFAGDAITITAAANGGAEAACSSAPVRCPLAVGTNVITVTVAAFDGGTTQHYTVAVTRASDGALGELALGGGALHPAFISTTLVYTALVGNTTASTVVTATAAQPGDGVDVVAAANGGVAAPCTGAPFTCPLAVGVTVITTTVTAADGTPRSYVVTVTRPSAARLRDLSLAPLAVTPAFTGTTFAYTATAPVSHATSSTLVTPTAAFAGDTVGVVVASGACGGLPVACPLAVGENVITVTVTAFDGGIVNQYTVRITRASDAALGVLAVSAGPLHPPFVATTFAYTVAAVSHATANTVVTASVAFAGDVVTITAAANGGAAATCAGAPASCALAVGVNVITATVTATDGSSQHYTITLSRASDTTLSGLSITPGELHPAFLSMTLAYTAAVSNAATGVSVIPTGTDGDVISLAVAANGGTAACPAAPGACPLAVGVNVITITVTTTDGTQRAYTVTITRALSSNTDLSGLALSVGTLTPAFAPATTAYVATVGNGVASLTLTPTAGEPNATIMVNGAAVTSGSASAPIALSVGPNVITTTVTAQDGVTLKHYVVTVTRASQGMLGELALGGGTLTPSFDAAIYNYTAAVDARTTSIVVTATVTQPGDSIVVAVAANGGAPVACPGSPAACPLAPGVNVVTIVVTAADGTTTTYTVTVTRPTAGVDAINDAASMLQGAAVVIAPLANDHDPVGGGLAVTSVGQPAHGAVVIDPGAQTVTYTPDPAITGVDSFTYVARDANGSVDAAMVTVLVTGRSQTDEAPQIGVVDNATGATLTFTDTTFVVEVQAPAGLYTGTLGPRDIFYLVYTVVVTPTGDVHQPPDGLQFGNLLFDMRAFLNADQLENYHFPSPVTLVIAYDPAQLGNLNEATLTPLYWNGAAWSSDGVTVVARDLTAHTLTLTISHLSEFAFFGGQGDWDLFMPFVASASVTMVAAPEAPVATSEAAPFVPSMETPVAPPPADAPAALPPITEPTPVAEASIQAPAEQTPAPTLPAPEATASVLLPPPEGELASVTPEVELTEAVLPTQ